MRHLLCLSFLLLPVAAAPDEKPAEDPRRLKPDHAPTPYTADEIRKATPEGRVNVIRVERGEKSFLMTMTFVKCDEKGAEMELTAVGEDGEEKKNRQTATWKELQTHGSFPEKDTKITEETIEVPAGKFDCWLYTVTKRLAGKEVTMKLHFAKTLAGPPVKMVSEADGKIESSMTLVECKLPEKKDGEKPEGEKPESEEPAGN